MIDLTHKIDGHRSLQLHVRACIVLQLEAWTAARSCISFRLWQVSLAGSTILDFSVSTSMHLSSAKPTLTHLMKAGVLCVLHAHDCRLYWVSSAPWHALHLSNRSLQAGPPCNGISVLLGYGQQLRTFSLVM